MISFTAFADSPVCVTAQRVSMHEEANSKSPVTWTVTQNMPLMRLEKKGNWAHVQDVDGDKHWIPANAVSGRVPCAVVRVKNARLRRGPSSSAPIAELSIADHYTPFRRVGGEGEFVELQDEYGEHYWASDKSVWYPVKKLEIKF